MTDFTDQFASDIQTVLTGGELTQTVSYTPKGGEAVDVTGWLLPFDTELDDGFELGERLVKRRRLVIAAGNGAVIETPQIDDLVSAGGEDWCVKGIDNEGLGFAELSLVNVADTARQHEMHRKRIE